jgi:hypothetical protein
MKNRKLSATIASQVVKCNQCNIVINEVLCFVQNKHEIMDTDSLIRICVTAFTKEDIDRAKSLLFLAVPTDLRNIVRKMSGKMQRDMEDIINVFKRTDPEKIPMFVAHNLNKLPPITFDHVDVTRLLRDLLVLRSEVDNIKENYVTKEQWTQANPIRPTLPDMSPNVSMQSDSCQQTVNQPNSDLFVNKRSRGGQVQDYAFDCNSGPFGIVHIPAGSSTEEETADNEHASHCALEVWPSFSRAAGVGEAERAGELPPFLSSSHNINKPIPLADADTEVPDKVRLKCIADSNVTNCATTKQASTVAASNAMVQASGTCEPGGGPVDTERVNGSQRENTCLEKKSFATVLSEKGEWKDVLPRHGREHKRNLRLKNRIIGKQGTAKIDPNCKFKAADIRLPLFVYNVDKNVSSHDIEDYVEARTRLKVKADRVEVKAEKNYIAYKILVPNYKMSAFLDDNMWPEEISFRRFIEHKHVNRVAGKNSEYGRYKH